ncbi:hypothetical protein [Rubellimicrobium roseum]|uniref:Ribosome modulation factor n=1 Tax=Rubellimicrobium roseum TaxID=687525 RepID=A0A5C4NKV1_9RHOB|nr:hypothetical protein [Rubellimicrobium roseum]TNC74620.1 hypothetical protein FHG71_00315 [Rubellimicrobium roseum]
MASKMGGDPREEGRIACETGGARGDCPYPAGTPEHEAWAEGWDEAEEMKVISGEEDGAAPA